MMRTGARLAIFVAVTSLLVASCSGPSAATKHAHQLKHELKHERRLQQHEQALKDAVIRRDLALKQEEALANQASHPAVAPTTTVVTAPATNPGESAPAANQGLTLSKHKILLGVTPPVTAVRRHGGHARHHHGHGHNHGLRLPHNH